jgi:NAD(P)-dependent dehydrogenase (short-subunit alcohol dehydrogenase family)
VSKPVALVTGGSSGIGLGIARRLVDRGCEVVLSARGQDRLDPLGAELGVTGVAADVATEEGRAAVVAAVRRLGRLDWLVNNAGAGGGTAGLDVDAERRSERIPRPARSPTAPRRPPSRPGAGLFRLPRAPRVSRSRWSTRARS